MARPVITPLNIQATAPETFCVLQQRMRVAEEQTESLISDLQALGVNCQSMELEYLKSAEGLRPISPLKARAAFVGENDTLWRNCENLVNRMCRLESVMQTLKLGVFRLHTERKLNPKQSAELEQRLSEVQEEHEQELRDAQLEVMRLRQRLNNEIEKREREEDAKERLSAALEIATATKTDVAITAEKMKAAKLRMKQRLVELQEKLSQEAYLRGLLEDEQTEMLRKVEDMKRIVEEERAQVQELQQNCQKMRREGQELKSRLQEEETRNHQQKEENLKLHVDLDARELLINQLQEEATNTRKSRDAEQAEFAKVRNDLMTLQQAAERVQCLNQQLEGQCSELNVAVQKLSTEKTQLLLQHKEEIKTAQDNLVQKLQEKEFILNATQTGLTAELQNFQSVRTQLERELESLRAEHSECQRKAVHAEQKVAVQKEVQESTIVRLRADLDSALRLKAVLESEMATQQEEMDKVHSEFQEMKQNVEVELKKNKLELGSLQSALSAQEQENRRLMECVALLEQEQHSQRQVDGLLTELMESKNKLAYEKGKLQSTVDQLKSELQSLCDSNSENTQLRKLNDALETKYAQLNTELDSYRIRLQRTEARLHQAQTVLLRKEEDFNRVTVARDQALKEENKLRGQLKAAEERGERTIAAMQQQLSEVREERNRLSSTLDNVVSSHTRLQKNVEKLQTELGHKDTDIAALHRESDHSQKQIQTLETELSQCQMKLQSTDDQKRTQIEPLQRAIEVAREDNKTLVHALQKALQQSSTLRNRVNELEKDLQTKDVQEQQLQIKRTQAEDKMQIQAQEYEQHITSLRNQHQAECKDTKKAAQRELAEVKKALDSATAKTAGLARANRELRTNITEQEKTVLHQKNMICNLKTQLRANIESKVTHKQADRVQELEAELRHMEKVKEEFKRSSEEQSKHIEEFMAEVDSLRNAIAATSQEKTLKSQLEKEIQLRQKLEDTCQGLEKRVQELQEEKEFTEHKLREASVESEQISLSLEEAHRWFKSRSSDHHLETLKNRQMPSKQSSYKSTPEIASTGDCIENHLSHSVMRHFETKQKLKLISRNYHSNDAIIPSGERDSDIRS
ncbi:coiled-coil domain-containing protein 150 [Pelodytes ibericus]